MPVTKPVTYDEAVRDLEDASSRLVRAVSDHLGESYAGTPSEKAQLEAVQAVLRAVRKLQTTRVMEAA